MDFTIYYNYTLDPTAEVLNLALSYAGCKMPFRGWIKERVENSLMLDVPLLKKGNYIVQMKLKGESITAKISL